MSTRIITCRSIPFLLFLLPGSVSGQVSPAPLQGTVGSTGAAVIEKKPETFRLLLTLPAEGKDAKEALAKLEQLRRDARKKLPLLGAREESIRFGEPRILPGKSRSQRWREEMMRRYREQENVAPPRRPASKVTATVSLQAEWPLKGETVSDRLVRSESVRKRVKIAKLAGTRAAEGEPLEDMTEEQFMLTMEMQEMMSGPRPGEPVFLFVSKITEEDQLKATKEAFQSAKKQAALLASAADREIGNVTSLSSSLNTGDPLQTVQFVGGYPGFSTDLLPFDEKETLKRGGSSDEAAGPDPAKLLLQVTVTAYFELK